MSVFPSFTKTYHHKPYQAISPSNQELSANGKIVLITGAGTGVGEATAHAFAEAGAKVIVLCGRRLDSLDKVKFDVESNHPSTKVVAYSVDVSKEESVTEVFRDVGAKHGALDIVVNSAGHLSDKDPVLISMNSLLAHMAAAQVGTAPGSYASSKMAQGKMIEYVAKENVGKIRAYNVHPGTIVTDMSTKSVSMADDPEATRQGLVWDDGASEAVPRRKSSDTDMTLCVVSLPAHFSVWLSSKEGHAIPTGKYLWAHWDVHELKQRSRELFDDPVALTLTLSGWPFTQPEVIDK